MALRLGMPDLGWQLLLLAAAVVVGVLAGVAPAAAVVVALGLAFVGLVMANLVVGLCLFVFISFLEVLPGDPAFSFTKVAGLLLALSWLATVATRERDTRQFFSSHPFATYTLALFLVWVGVSALWAENQSVALTAVSRFGLNFVLFPIVYTAIRERAHLVWVALAFASGAVISTLFGMATGSPLGDEGRLSGAVGESNELASVLVAALVLAAGVGLASRRSPGLRLALLGAAAFCAAGVFLSLSRAGIVALCLVLVTGVFVAGRWRGKAAAIALVTVMAGVTYFTAYATPAARERITTVEGGSGRVDLWAIGWRMVEDKPLTGVGAGNFQISSPHYLLEPGAFLRDDFVLDRPKQTHNIYLQVLSELGIPGLALFMTIIGFAVWSAARAARTFRQAGDTHMEILSWTFFVAAVGVLATDFFQSEQFSKQLWLLLAMGPALLGLARHSSADHAGPEAGDVVIRPRRSAWLR